jgi:hypothetical protein
MTAISWPTKPEIPDTISSKLSQLQSKLEHTDDTPKLMDISPWFGGGRAVYDISEFTENPFVIKIPFNDYGKVETSNELTIKSEISPEKRTRLAPIYDIQNEYCVVQPKCETIQFKNVNEAEDNLQVGTANATGLDPVDEANMKLIQTTTIMPL